MNNILKLKTMSIYTFGTVIAALSPSPILILPEDGNPQAHCPHNTVEKPPLG